MKSSMKIGLDIDGTISTMPDYYAEISNTVESVVVISPRLEVSREETVAQLNHWGIKYDALHLFKPYEDGVEQVAV